jgi:hypothetical protein
MWLLPSMPPHMHNQHVLSFERFFFTAALLPLANERLFVGSYMVTAQMLEIKQKKLSSFQSMEYQKKSSGNPLIIFFWNFLLIEISVVSMINDMEFMVE